MKKISLFFKITIVLSALFIPQNIFSQENNIIDEIAWVVGDEAILKSEIEKMRKDMLMRRMNFEGDPYCSIAEQMAIGKLFLNQARIDSVSFSDSQVRRMVDANIKYLVEQAGSEKQLEEWLDMSMSRIREDKRKEIEESFMINEVKNKIMGEVSLSPSEIRKFYASIPKDELPFIPTTLEVQIVTLEPHIPQKDIDEVKERLRDYTEKINSGESEFSTIALLYSEDQGSAVKGGELGFMGRAEFVPEFSQAAFALNDPSKISNIVKTEYGYHIIQLVEKRGDRGNFRHILIKPKVQQEEIEKSLVKMDSICTLIEKGEISFDDAATYISSDKNTRNNKGLLINLSPEKDNGGTSLFELDELNQDIAREIGSKEVGEISKPFVMTTHGGDKVVAIAKVAARNEGHKANLNIDYQFVKKMSENKKGEEKLEQWIKDKIQKTYVKIDPDWRNCDFKYKGWIK